MTSRHAVAIVDAADEGDHTKLERLIADARTVAQDLNYMEPDASGRRNCTALGIAASKGHERCVEILLKDPRLTKDTLDARASAYGGRGTALTSAAAFGHTQCVQMILHDARTTEATVNAKGANDAPAINGAAFSGSERILDLLLTDPRTTAAAVNSRSDKGATALGVACQQGHERCVEMLLMSSELPANPFPALSKLLRHKALEHGVVTHELTEVDIVAFVDGGKGCCNDDTNACVGFTLGSGLP